MLYPPEVRVLAKRIQEMNVGLKMSTILSLDDMLKGHRSPYPYRDIFVEVFNEHILIICISGSTGTQNAVLATIVCANIQARPPETWYYDPRYAGGNGQ